MARLMSVAFTEQAVVERRKTVTRRKGWAFLKPGDHLTLVRKAMGRTRQLPNGTTVTEPLVRLAQVEVVSVTRSPLGMVRAPGELTAEGFPELESWPGPFAGAQQFIDRYFAPQGLGWDDEVTRIKWRYIETCWSTTCATEAPAAHTPCCSAHSRPLCCKHYNRLHFVEVDPCTPDVHREAARV